MLRRPQSRAKGWKAGIGDVRGQRRSAEGIPLECGRERRSGGAEGRKATEGKTLESGNPRSIQSWVFGKSTLFPQLQGDSGCDSAHLTLVSSASGQA